MASNILLTPTATNQKRALLIGNTAYSHGNQFRYCVNDAKDLGNTLRSINFQVNIGTNLTCEQMDLMIEEFSNTICSGDLVLFFFSGHGRQLNDHNFLIPIDDDRIRHGIDLKYRAINAQSTLERIMNHRPSAAIFFLDCCCIYMLPNEAETRGPRSSGGLATMQPSAGSLIAFACGAGKTIRDGSSNSRNNIFTAHLLEHITQPNVTVDEIMYDVCDGVMSESDDYQCPVRVSTLRRKVYLNKQGQSD